MSSQPELEPTSSVGQQKTPRWWLLVGAGFLALGFLVNYGMVKVGEARAAQEAAAIVGGPPVIEASAAKRVTRDYSVKGEGFLRPVARIDVVPEVAGKVVAVADSFEAGRNVAKGAVLFAIDDRTYKADLAQAQADRRQAVAALAQAKAEASRQEELVAIGAASQATVDAAVANLAGARARIAQADAAITLAAKRLEDTQITAPFDAQVQSENVSIGQYVAPGSPVAQIWDVTAAEIPVSLTPNEAAGVRRALDTQGPLTVRVMPTPASASEGTMTGQLTELSASLDPQSRTVTALVTVPDAFNRQGGDAVFADDFLAVEIPARAADTLYAAAQSVIRQERFVWRITDESTLHRENVTPVTLRDDGMVLFSAENNLNDALLVETALSEEAEGIEVQVASGSTTTEPSIAAALR